MGQRGGGGSDPLTPPPPQARIQDFLKGGGVKTFTSTHTPLGHCPRDVIRPSEKLKSTPTLGHSQAHTHPLDIARVTSSTFQGGGGDRSLSAPITHTLHRFSGSGQVQGGGGSLPSPTHPPPDSPMSASTKVSI